MKETCPGSGQKPPRPFKFAPNWGYQCHVCGQGVSLNWSRGTLRKHQRENACSKQASTDYWLQGKEVGSNPTQS